MKYYKLFLVTAIIIIIALFCYPRAVARAAPEGLPEAPEAPIERVIAQYASYYGVDGKLALAIAKCESRLDSNISNPKSSAKGIYQFLGSSWTHYSNMKWGKVKDVFSAKDNIELGVWVLATEGTSPWESSRGCWDPL